MGDGQHEAERQEKGTLGDVRWVRVGEVHREMTYENRAC